MTMINHFIKHITIVSLLVVLSACDGGTSTASGSRDGTAESNTSANPDTSSNPDAATNPDTVTNPDSTAVPDATVAIDLNVGKVYYDAACSSCHGNQGENIFRPINTDNCQIANCDDIEEMAIFIAENMPQDDPGLCEISGENSCAITTAAYILNGFNTEHTDPSDSSEPSEPTAPADENVPTPLARLTNAEYVNSVRTLLGLPADSAHIDEAQNSLVSESIVRGLSNDATTQALTQLSISGYSSMAFAATEDFFENTNSRKDLAELLNCTVLLDNMNATLPSRACIEEFIRILLGDAYRRPVTDLDMANITEIYDGVTSQNDEAGNSTVNYHALRNILQAIFQYILLSPEFVLVVEYGQDDPTNSTVLTKRLTDYEIATRLALFLAGTLPDDALLSDASAGKLGNAAVRLQHAERLMNSDTGIEQFSKLILNWLDIDESLASENGLETINEFVTNWFVDEQHFSNLYQAPVTVKHTNGTESTETVGILGLQAFVASHTSYPTPSFITRGVFVVEQLLCEALPDDLPDAALDAGQLTPVQVFELHAQQSCATCHKVFDNYGAAFQQYDAETSLFNPTSQDFGSSFDLYPIGGDATTVSTVDDLGYHLASSARASSCMTELWYRHSMRRNIDANGKDNHELEQLINTWAESGDKSMKALLRAVVTSEAFITLYL